MRTLTTIIQISALMIATWMGVAFLTVGTQAVSIAV